MGLSLMGQYGFVNDLMKSQADLSGNGSLVSGEVKEVVELK